MHVLRQASASQGHGLTLKRDERYGTREAIEFRILHHAQARVMV